MNVTINSNPQAVVTKGRDKGKVGRLIAIYATTQGKHQRGAASIRIGSRNRVYRPGHWRSL